MDVLAWLFDQGGRGLCLGLLAYMLAKLALGYVETKPVPLATTVSVTDTRAHARIRNDANGPSRESDSDHLHLRDGWQTTRSQERPEAETLLLLDLYVFLRRSWDDGHEARQTKFG